MLADLVAPFLFSAAVVLLSSLWHRRWRGARARVWRAVARELELKAVSEGPAFRASLTGWSGTRAVRFEHIDLKYFKGTRLVVGGESGITLWPENDPGLSRTSGASELQLGDPAFDDEVYLGGAPEALRAVLDVWTRAAVRELLHLRLPIPGSRSPLKGRAGVRDGEIVLSLPDAEYLARPERLSTILGTLLELAARLDRPPDPVARIAENSRREPDWRIRLQNVAFLAERYPGHFAAREALEAGCRDEHPEVRLRAATGLGEEGRATLLEIASLESAEDSCAARAVEALGEHLSVENALGILGGALRGRRRTTARACLESLGRAGGPSVVAPLAKVLAVERGELAAAAARALGASGEAAAEAPLLEALARDAADVRVAAAEGLGHAGSVAAVLPLKELAARGDGAERRAGRQAIAEIQARLHGASPGQLSLAAGDAGGLSLADDASGRVSLADAGEAK